MFVSFTVYPNHTDGLSYIYKELGDFTPLSSNDVSTKNVFPSFKLSLGFITIRLSIVVIDCSHEWQDESDDEYYRKVCKHCTSWQSIPKDMVDDLI